jgi:hypothetical protein
MGSGFFAFSDPKRSRPIDAWLMAASPECPLILKLRDRVNAYWQHNRLRHHRRTTLARVLHLLDLDPHTARLWFSYPVRKLLRAYPYMWLPYLFAELVRSDPECRSLWQGTVKMSAKAPHRLQQFGLLEVLSDEARAEIDAGETPVYKLTWKFRGARYHEASTLHYLFERHAITEGVQDWARAWQTPSGRGGSAADR